VNLSAGAAQKNLLLRDLRSYRFAMPKSLDEQRVVGRSLDALSEETQRLARLYERKHAALEALKKSLLHQAFTGEL
jgi:type I restriction enzyme S subunit